MENVELVTPSQQAPRAKESVAIAAGLFVMILAICVGTFAGDAGLGPDPTHTQGNSMAWSMSQTIDTRGIDAALAQYAESRARGFVGTYEDEEETNDLGYRLVEKKQYADAIKIFELNVQTHPQSANAYDSLGEAYQAAGTKALAIENFRKALALDPYAKDAGNSLRNVAGESRKRLPILVILHISAGLIGIISGFVALFLRKGTRRHRTVGNVFFVSMLAMGSLGAYVAMTLSQPSNIIAGALTSYLVLTAWIAGRNRNGIAGLLNWAALLIALAVGATEVCFGLAATRSAFGTEHGLPAPLYFVFGAVALLAAAGDVRLLVRGGVFGAQRIIRHLWRMCFALFIAASSLFLGQPQVFPEAVRNANVLFIPSVVIVVCLLYWLVRVRFGKQYRLTT